MAVETVERTLQRHGAPVYVFHEIVHNQHVVRDFTQRGVHFVQSIDDVPRGARLVFSAHGVSPSVWQKAKEKRSK
jgi:4-hydroxy-3-methylbut-2-enyl diphosphate reductase